MSKEADKEFIENIVFSGSREEKLALYQFNLDMDNKEIAKRFNLFVVGNFIRYYKSDPAPFHHEMIENYIMAYRGDSNYLNIGFRGCAKTSLKKLFDTFTLLNDKEKSRKFYKVMTKDLNNSKQIVTDVYNLMIEVAWLYGDVFEKEGKKKQEETMSAFVMKDGRRYAGGTVGQTQRGQVTDDSRPDFVWFEDIEDSDTIRSVVKTQTSISKADEAIQGLSFDGNYVVTANYITEEGIIQWFMDKEGINTQITPIIDAKGKPLWEKYTPVKLQLLENDAEDWAGDYLCKPDAGKHHFFTRELVEEAMKHVEEPLKEINGIKIWKQYYSHHVYGMGADISEGVGLDANALTLFDFTKGEVIATYKNNEIEPDMFGYELSRLGRLYGECVVAPEKNAVGAAALAALKEDSYGNIYREEVIDRITSKKTLRLGWATTAKSKPIMLFAFKKAFEDGLIKIYDIDLLEEMKHYTGSDLTETSTALATRHFDLLISACIGYQMQIESQSNSGGSYKTSY